MRARFVILSDIHLATDDIRAILFRQAIARATELNADWIVLLGDTVETGTAAEYALARRIVTPVRLRLRALPGNHEYLKGTPADFTTAWLTAPATADILDNLPIMRFDTGVTGQRDEEYFGRIRPDQFRLLDSLLQAHQNSPAILFSHHPLRDTVRRSDQFQFTIENSQELVDRIAAHHAPTVIFTGHTHWQSVVRRDRLTCIGCPPLGYWPHAFLVVDVDANELKYQTVRLMESPEQSPDKEIGDPQHRIDAEGSADDQTGIIQFAGI